MIYFISRQSKAFESTIKSATVQDLHNWLSANKIVGVDTETTGFDAHSKKLLTIQFGNYEDQFVVDCSTVPLDSLGLGEYFENPEYLWLFQNAKFDLRFLMVYDLIPNKIYDTMLAEQVLNNDGTYRLSAALDSIAKRYLNVDLDKSIRGNIHREGLTDRVITYAADDSKYLEQIMNLQLKKAKELDVDKHIWFESEAVKSLAYIEYCGFKLDSDQWRAKIKEDKDELEQRREALNQWVIENGYTDFMETQLDLFKPRGVSLNWNSSQQVIKLFKQIGINVKNPQGKESVEEKNIKYQQKEFDILSLYFAYKEKEKENTTYGDNILKLIHPITGRLHTEFTQIKATGRVSSGGGNSKGLNLQNLPREDRVRRCFVAEEGNSLVVCDYSQQEAVLFADNSQDENMLDFFSSGEGDIHSFVAKRVFSDKLKDVDVKDVKKEQPDLRYLAKTVGFSTLFGGSGYTIAKNANVSEEKGEEVYGAYMKAFPGVEEYFEKQREFVFSHGYILVSPLTGFKFFTPDALEIKAAAKRLGIEDYDFYSFYRTNNYRKIKGSSIEYSFKSMLKDLASVSGAIIRKSYNFPQQGAAAIMTKLAMIKIFDWTLSNGYLHTVKFVSVVHDEVLLECPDTISEEVSGIVQKSMIEAGDTVLKTLKIKAEPVITKFWQK